LARLRALPFVDNTSRFRGLPDPESWFLPDGHLNERGNAKLAENVRDALLVLEGAPGGGTNAP
jgi:hypothetical protein